MLYRNSLDVHVYIAMNFRHIVPKKNKNKIVFDLFWPIDTIWVSCFFLRIVTQAT